MSQVVPSRRSQITIIALTILLSTIGFGICLPVLPVYAALKCAMSSIMRSLAVELAEHGVTANSLLPGL